MKAKSSRPAPPVRKGAYAEFLGGLTALLEEARRAAARSINTILTATYWEVGRRIVEFEQQGSRRAGYGERLLERLASDLTARFGRGFGLSNVKQMKKFFAVYKERPIGQTASGLLAGIGTRKSQTLSGFSSPPRTSFPLPWSHYVRLLVLDEPDKRDFYEEEARRGGWSVRQLDRQINAMLYERVALSRKKGELLLQAERRTLPRTPEAEIKDPYLLEFLGLPEPHSEKDLENALIQHLADFLLELGYGFSFVARQRRFQIGSESYFLDLLLFPRGLRCLVAIDLKVGKFTHADAGQMNLYLNYLQENETLGGEAAPVGLILCAEKDEAVAHYALGGLSNKVFASRYKLQLPDPEILKREIESERRRLERRMLSREGQER